LSELAWLRVRDALGIHADRVLTLQQPEVSTIFRQKKVMVTGYAIGSDIDAAATRKVIVTVDPD